MMSGQSQTAAPQKRVEPTGATKHGINCVFLTCFDSDFYFLANVLLGSIRMHRAETLEQADFLLTVTEGTVLLTDVSFLDGFWHEAADMLAQFHPMVAFLVLADERDRQFVSEAPNRGACGILWKPLEFIEVSRSIRTAHEAFGERMIWQQERCAGASSPWIKSRFDAAATDTEFSREQSESSARAVRPKGGPSLQLV
jgi:DNA-binding NarL/FixJ family response regulator